MTTMQAGELSVEDIQRLERHAEQLRDQLRILELASLEDSERAVQLRTERHAVKEVVQAWRAERQAETRERYEAAERREAADAERGQREEQETAAAVAFLEPLLSSGPVLRADVLRQAEEAGITTLALLAALAELQVQDFGRYGREGRVGPATHWGPAGWRFGGGFGRIAAATL